MITGIIIHLSNDLPVVVDMEELPAGADRAIKCTNVRTVDGKRPPFVHDRHSTFILPLNMIRAIEIPNQNTELPTAQQDRDRDEQMPFSAPVEVVDEESEEDLLARIRQI